MTEKLTGLTPEEVKDGLKKYGRNVLPEKPPPSDLEILISQIKNPLVYILVVAGIVTFILREIPDTVIIGIAVFLNTILSFFQERKANKALYALKKLIHPKAKVIREGKEVEIDAEEIVPQELVVLDQGVKVPADGELLEANRLFLDEAILTGESVSVSKDQTDEVFMGTVVSSGRGLMKVLITGEDTQMGKIAVSIQEPSEDTPLQKQLSIFSRQLSFLVLFLVLFVFSVGLFKKLELVEIFETSVALAVSSIPEGILVGLTIVLAIGMQRILKKKGLVRSLISAETLGGVTTICIDKTGTLTEGKMRVVDAVGGEEEIAKQMVLANDHDDPLVIAAFEWAGKVLRKKKVSIGNMIEVYDRLDSVPFSSEKKYFASLHKWKGGNNKLFVNGAPEVLLDWSDLKEKDKKEIRRMIEQLTSQGKRVVGLASKNLGSTKKNIKEQDVRKNLTWVGLLAFSDPVRGGVKEALEKTKKAGIKLTVITGDYSQTAKSVMSQLDIHTCDDCLMLGKELEKVNVGSLSERLKKHPITLFARTTPQQKLIIVEALKKNGEVVAMMGDGVNDAPALNKADIGIVVGEATDVAKESADLVLLDSSFATIVSAIEEGRGIFDNVRKIILYLMSDSFEEIFVVVGAMLLGFPLPVTAAQILWINLVSDGFPDMALTIDHKQKGIMERSPRSPTEGLVANWMKYLILIISLSGGIVALILFSYFYLSTGDIVLARSIAFATLGVNSLVYVFSIRTLTQPFWEDNPFSNGWLNISVVAGFILQILPFMSEGLRSFFKVTYLTISQWLLIFCTSLIMFIIIEVSKITFRDLEKHI